MPEDRELLTAGESGGGGGMLTSGDMGDTNAELLTGLALRPAAVGNGVGLFPAAGLAVLLAEKDPSVAGAAWPAAVLLTATGSGDVSSEAPALAFAAVLPLTRGEPYPAELFNGVFRRAALEFTLPFTAVLPDGNTKDPVLLVLPTAGEAASPRPP